MYLIYFKDCFNFGNLIPIQLVLDEKNNFYSGIIRLFKNKMPEIDPKIKRKSQSQTS